VAKTQYENLHEGHNETYALNHLKVAFVVGFYSRHPDVEMKVYFCCTNFKDVAARIKKLYNRHSGNMQMLMPKAISLISCDINGEIARVRNMDFSTDDFNSAYNNITKSFDIEMEDAQFITPAYSHIIDMIRMCRFQPYQARMDKTINSDGFQISDKVVKRIKDADGQFFKDTLPYAQMYLKCYIRKLLNSNGRFLGYGYQIASRIGKIRADLGNINMTDRIYAIAKIKSIAFADDGTNLFDDMVVDGTISKSDIATLRKIANVEGVDTSGLTCQSRVVDASLGSFCFFVMR